MEPQTNRVTFDNVPLLESGVRYATDITEDQRGATILFDNLHIVLSPDSLTRMESKVTSIRIPLNHVTTAQALSVETTVAIEVEGAIDLQGGARAALALVVNGEGQFLPLPAAVRCTNEQQPAPVLLQTVTKTINAVNDLFVTLFLVLEAHAHAETLYGMVTIDRIGVGIQVS